MALGAGAYAPRVRDEYDLVVAGGGLAGLSAGLTAARLGRSVLVLAGAVPGGLLLTIDRIDGFPGHPDGIAGYELCPTVQSQVEATGAEVVGAELEELEAGGVFPLVGLRPNSERFALHGALDAEGAVLTDDRLRTTADGIFAAGIVRSGAVAGASATSGEGATAALAADAYLAGSARPGATAVESM